MQIGQMPRRPRTGGAQNVPVDRGRRHILDPRLRGEAGVTWSVFK